MDYSSDELYSKWRTAWNKDDLKFYADKGFQRDYTRLEMEGKARMFKERALKDVTDALEKISSQTGRIEIRILSLGCGPGSDLLGILGAVVSALRSGVGSWGAGKLQCDCTGVDAFNWNRDDFIKRINSYEFRGLLGQIRCVFALEDMENYVLNSLQGYQPEHRKFDFICMSFADAGRNLAMVGTALPQLLSEFGRILVLDNDIRTVRSLTNYGFTCTCAGYNICMHSRGRGSSGYRVSYAPSANSPILTYRREKIAAGKQEAELARLAAQRQASYAAPSYRGNSNVYPRVRPTTSWCEGICTIL